MADIEHVVRSLVGEINQQAIALSTRALNIMRNSAVEVLGRNGTGRVYKRGRGFHVASSPGQPPAPDTGNLRRNWQQSKFISGKLRIRLRLKSRMHYYDYLNSGTRKMAQRPIEKPVKEKATPKIRELYANL